MEQANTKFEVPILAQVLYGFAISVLVMVGIAGSIYKLVAPEGWVVQAFGQSFSLGASLLAALLGAAALPLAEVADRGDEVALLVGQLEVHGGGAYLPGSSDPGV